MALDHSKLGLENKYLESKSCRIFPFDKFALQNLANKSEGRVNQPLYFLYITFDSLRWNNTMRRCFYRTDLRQNSVFHNFEI